MSDFLLDFRSSELRRQSTLLAASALKFCDDTQVQIIERDAFSLVLTSVDNLELWGPYESRSAAGNILVALAGRVAFEGTQWQNARGVDGDGGLAGKAIFDLYRRGGANALGQLNGHFVVFIYDDPKRKAHLVTDRFGMCLAYGPKGGAAPPVFCSHPDVLASVIHESGSWDRTSLAEFLMTGRLSFPHTYYRGIKALETGSIHTFAIRDGGIVPERPRAYFRFDFKVDPQITEMELSERLAEAFKNAVRRRTLPIFGSVGLSLSGGLDSRAILSAIEPRNQVRAFTLFDEENAEFGTARAIAKACNVELTPIKRDSEHYGNWAELGVRISGGTGCIRSNHYLGVRRQLREMGVQNLLTGCYCDYVFKGLALNTRESRFLRVQQLSHFDFEYYLPCYWPNTSDQSHVRERLRNLFPEADQGAISEQDWLEIERKRTFPLSYEGDSAMRLIPQRVIPWYLPIADNDLMNVYLRTPSRYKLNASVFRKMLSVVCDVKVLRIPDNNTGARIEAGPLSHACHRYRIALQNRLEQRILPRMAVRGSWPNWEYYVHHSPVVARSWEKQNETARALFTEILGEDPFARRIESYRGREVELFTRIWTLKLWLDQRYSVN